jgi:hypothetical protein
MMLFKRLADNLTTINRMYRLDAKYAEDVPLEQVLMFTSMTGDIDQVNANFNNPKHR